MGLFDKLKASVGVGGAKVELHVPGVWTAGGPVLAKITVRGGNLDQVLNGLDLVLQTERDVEHKDPQTGKTTMRKSMVEVWKHRIDLKGEKIAKGSERVFEHPIEVPPFLSVYSQSALADIFNSANGPGEPFYLLGAADEPLPTTSLPRSSLTVSADIPGAIDPSASRDVFVVPEAAGPLRATGRLEGDDALPSRLQASGAHGAFPVLAGESWFIFFTAGLHTVAVADLKAVVSARDEELLRAHANPRVPPTCAVGKLPSDTQDSRPGDMAVAFDWAREVAAQAPEADAILHRPVGNTVFALASLHMV